MEWKRIGRRQEEEEGRMDEGKISRRGWEKGKVVKTGLGRKD